MQLVKAAVDGRVTDKTIHADDAKTERTIAKAAQALTQQVLSLQR